MGTLLFIILSLLTIMLFCAIAAILILYIGIFFLGKICASSGDSSVERNASNNNREKFVNKLIDEYNGNYFEPKETNTNNSKIKQLNYKLEQPSPNVLENNRKFLIL